MGRVTEMMECVRPGEVFSFIRVRCEMCMEVNDDEMTGAVLYGQLRERATEPL